MRTPLRNEKFYFVFKCLYRFVFLVHELNENEMLPGKLAEVK